MDLGTTSSVAPFIGILGLIFAGLTYASVKRLPPGNATMVEIAEAIHHGAMVFLKREYQIVTVFIVGVFPARRSETSPRAARPGQRRPSSPGSPWASRAPSCR